MLLSTGVARGLEAAATPSLGDEREAPSLAQLRLHQPLAPLLEHLEKRIPRQLDRWSQWQPWHGLEVKYRLRREPLRLWMHGNVLHLATRVTYRVSARKRLFKRFELSAGCGVNEPPRVVELHLAAQLGWTPSWRLASRTLVFPNRFLNPCRVGPLDTDVTPLIDRFLRRELARAARRGIDEQVPRLIDLRPDAERVWERLQAPLQVADSLWLELRPEAIGASPPQGPGEWATLLVQLALRPHIGLAPPPPAAPRPLPSLRPARPRPPGFHLQVKVTLGLERINQQLAEHLQGQAFELGGQALDIDSARVSAEGNALRVRVALGGIPVQLSGRLHYDPSTRTLHLADPEPHLALNHPLAALLDKTAAKALGELLQGQIHWSLAPRIEALRASLEQALNRPLAPDARLRTEIRTLTPGDFTLRGDRIELALHVDAVMEVLLEESPHDDSSAPTDGRLPAAVKIGSGIAGSPSAPSPYTHKLNQYNMID